nr:MAG TPA: hypothetical protein [Caudoviricetes sp.]DAN72521.1 MAG TPA: hypothetical protein [Caudoviricetes sp.]
MRQSHFFTVIYYKYRRRYREDNYSVIFSIKFNIKKDNKG